MKESRMVLFMLSICCIFSYGQHTFSIVAVDTVSGEVGSAGATCLDETREGVAAVIISDIIPGIGAIHTQSYLNFKNKQNANFQLRQGKNAKEIMNWLENNDAEGRASFRQYGVALLDAPQGNKTAAYTGLNCLKENGHIIGPNYAIQGNILINQSILEKMEEGFLQTEGSLAEKLMGAMLGANIQGADARCFNEGVSSRSAFIRLAKPNDLENDLTLDIQVNATPFAVEPIQIMKERFESFQLTRLDNEQNINPIKVFPNPVNDHFTIELPYTSVWLIELYQSDGRRVYRSSVFKKSFQLSIPDDYQGILILKVKEDQKGGIIYSTKIMAGA